VQHHATSALQDHVEARDVNKTNLSHIHCFVPGSKLTFSTNLFHHSLLTPTWAAFSDYTGPDFLCSTFFIFSFFFFFFILGRAVD